MHASSIIKFNFFINATNFSPDINTYIHTDLTAYNNIISYGNIFIYRNPAFFSNVRSIPFPIRFLVSSPRAFLCLK